MNIFNEGTGSVFPGLYIHMWSKYTRADIGETRFSQTSVTERLQKL